MAEPKIAELLTKAKELGVEDEAAARKLIKENSVRSFKRLVEVITATNTKKSAAVIRVRKSTSNKIHNEGPRGFKFGPVWLASIKAIKGIAMSPSNLPKVIKTAQSKGVETEGKTQQEIVEALAKTL